MENRYCIVRCENAGVFAGIVKERSGREVTLTDCRRLWYWEGAASCSQLAVDGTKKPRVRDGRTHATVSGSEKDAGQANVNPWRTWNVR